MGPTRLALRHSGALSGSNGDGDASQWLSDRVAAAATAHGARAAAAGSDGRTDGRTGGRADGRADGRTDGRTGERANDRL